MTHEKRLALLKESEALNQLIAELQEQVEVLSSWRENRQNGYVLCLTTAGASAIRHFEYDRQRNCRVVTPLLGPELKGHLVSDFYGAYNVYNGLHQRCKVHLLRDQKHLQ